MGLYSKKLNYSYIPHTLLKCVGNIIFILHRLRGWNMFCNKRRIVLIFVFFLMVNTVYGITSNDKELYEKGMVFFNHYQPNKAKIYFEELIFKYPNSNYFIDSIEKIMHILDFNKEYEEIIKIYKRYETEMKGIESENKEEVENIMALVARAFYFNADYSEAIKFERFIDKVENNQSRNEILLATILSAIELNDEFLYQNLKDKIADNDLLFSVGYKLLEKERIEEAFIYFTMFLENTNNLTTFDHITSDIYISLSNIYVELNKAEEIYNYFNKIISKVPEDYTNIDILYYIKAYLEMEIGLYDEAIKSFNYHIDHYPDSILLMNSLYYIYKIQNEIE